MGWLTGWTYRKSHLINSASGAGTLYQKRIIVHFSAGTDSDENVYLDGKCLTDFGDIRFTDKTGITLLDYWIEKQVDGDYAIFWVEISEDLMYDVKIYIYYGKAGATSLSNGNATFSFFDDFENDLSKWALKQGASISTDYAYHGIKSLKLEIISETNGFVSNASSLPKAAIHVRYYDFMSTEKECHFLMGYGGVEGVIVGPISDGTQYEYQVQDGGTIFNSGIDRTVGWHEFVVRGSSNSTRQVVIDGNVMPKIGPIGGFSIFMLAASAGGTQQPNSTGKAHYDLCFIRSWVDPEPAHGIWGAEESDGIGITTFIAEDIEDTISQSPLDLDDVLYSLSKSSKTTEDLLFSLSLTPFHSPPFASEDILYSTPNIRTLIAEDILYSTPNIRTLIAELLMFELSLRPFHTPPFLSEDIMLTMFKFVVQRKYPIMGGVHIIHTEGDGE